MSFLNLMRNRLKPKAVNDALTNVVQNSPPDFSSAEAGKILAVDSDGDLEWKDEYSYTPPTYSSTEEVNTGQKWIDGKDIYMKYFSGNVSAISELTSIELSLNLDSFIKAEGVCVQGGGNEYTLGAYVSSSVRSAVSLQTGSLYLTIGTGYSEGSYKVIVYYTKPDPVPTNETKSKRKQK